MSEKYISSITTRYGDIDNVKKDTEILNDIINRQGSNLLIDVIAQKVGNTVIKFKLSDIDATQIKSGLLSDLNEAINERI